MDVIKDLLSLFNLISDYIEFNHPLVLDIRYYFHLRVSRGSIYNTETWERKAWEEYVTEKCRYTLKSFIVAFCKDVHFRHNIIAVMGTDVEGLKTLAKEKV